MMNNVVVCLVFGVGLLGCSGKTMSGTSKINWQKIANTGKALDFCQLDSISDGYLLSYSCKVALGGGFKIIKMERNKLDSTSWKRNVLFESKINNISYVQVKGRKIGVVQDDFEQHSLRSTLLLSFNMGQTWNEVRQPLERIRNFVLTDEYLFIEGVLAGTSQVFKSSDAGMTWNKVNMLSKGVKSFYLLHDAAGRYIICLGSTSFNEQNRSLVLLDAKSDIFKKVLSLEKSEYVHPINNALNLYGVLSKHNLKVYSLKDELFELKETFKLPKGIGAVDNVFLGRGCSIITAREEQLKGNFYSWISYNKGDDWKEFGRKQGLKLLQSSSGTLFMIDSNHNILQRQ